MLDHTQTQAPGDPAEMAAAMIGSVEHEPAPLRLLLGSDAYQRVFSSSWYGCDSRRLQQFGPG